MNAQQLVSEIKLKGIRSSGAGGQHVNKVSSKIELTFDVVNSIGISEQEKERLYTSLQSKLTKEKILILQCSESRSQHRNKELAIKRFLKVITNGIKVQKYRKATKPTRSSVFKRLESKKTLALKKANRRKPEL
jgi:ribosome-associated protein